MSSGTSPSAPATRAAAGAAPVVGVVVIGRNEGERLRRSLASVTSAGLPVVYVDSGSGDGSPAVARAAGADVVELDSSHPCTAARGRNAGIERMRALAPDVRYLQCVDGDTEIDAGWIARAAAALDADPGLAAVCGHLRERGADASVLRRAMQLEWRGPVGDVRACGGNAMYRAEALVRVGTFRASIAGGEEPELCDRLRGAGYRIARIDASMGVHDSGVDSFGAWWRRAVRVGGWFAALAAGGGELHGGRATAAIRSALVWGLALPAVFAAGLAASVADARFALVSAGAAVLVVLQTIRIYLRGRSDGLGAADAVVYGVSCMLSKPAYAAGWWRHRESPAAPPRAAAGGPRGG